MARKLSLDMTNVETFSKASEGIHTAKLAEITEKDSQNGDPMLQAIFEITKGEDKGCRVYENFGLSDKALWKFKSFLIAIGMKAEGKIKIDLDKLIGKVCDIEVFLDEYNGKEYVKISDYYAVGKAKKNDIEDEDDEDDDEDEEDETPAKKSTKKSGKSKPVEDDEDDSDDEDEEELPKKRGRKSSKETTTKKGKSKKEPEPEDEDDDDDDEWEEDD